MENLPKEIKDIIKEYVFGLHNSGNETIEYYGNGCKRKHTFYIHRGLEQTKQWKDTGYLWCDSITRNNTTFVKIHRLDQKPIYFIKN